MTSSLSALQERLHHRFQNTRLLQQALTHRSFSATHNERLEFLGDSVLNISISERLFRQFPQATEGELSRMRANLVCEDSLHRIALALELPAFLQLGEGEARSGGRQRPSILADAIEALIGAVYLDAGFAAAQALVERFFASMNLSASVAKVASKDGKTALQEFLQGRKMPLPVYTVTDIQGAEHAQVFVVECRVDSLQLRTEGQGQSRRTAEQAAARQMVQQLQKHPIAERRT